MAEKRMFSKTIIDSDSFLEMSLSAQALYFHLSMRADDEGFVNNPKRILRSIGAKEKDFSELCDKRFIFLFESGVIAVKHWFIHNYIRSDRFKETLYKCEKASLVLDERKAYIEREKGENDVGIPLVYQMDAQYRIDKNSIDKNNIISTKNNKKIAPPSLEEISAYCAERKNGIDPEQFFDYYSARGWMTGKNVIKDWKSAVRTWEHNKKQKAESNMTIAEQEYRKNNPDDSDLNF